MAHTPGPWTVGEEIDSAGRVIYIPIRHGKLRISNTGVFGSKPNGETAGRKYRDRVGIDRHQPTISAEECRANANLIAAAPDMYEALKAMYGDRQTFEDLAEKAISKAEGR